MSDSGYAKAKKSPQLFTTIVAVTGGFSLGTALSWTSPALMKIDEAQCLPDECDITGVSHEEASWIGALLSLGAVFSGPFAAYLMTKIGRKWTLTMLSIPLAVGFALFLVGDAFDNVVPIHVGRTLHGLGSGILMPTAPTYIMEISETSIRGMMANLLNFALTSGQAFVNGLNINNVISWQIITIICLCIPIVFGVGMLFVPESPRYLMSKDKEDKASEALLKLRGKKYDSSSEIWKIQEDLKKQEAVGEIALKDLWRNPLYLRPFLFMVLLMLFQQLAGINAVITYTQEIFADAGIDMDPGLSAFLVTSAKLCGSFMSVLLVDRFGRRLLLLFSELSLCVCLFPLGTFFYIQENTPGKFSSATLDSLSWLPLVSLVLYMVVFAIGVGPLPFTINAEIFPPESKAISASLVCSAQAFFSFVVTKFQPEFESLMGTSGIYYMYGTSCAVAFVFILVLFPETKGKSEEEIRNLFVGSDGEVEEKLAVD